MSSKDLESYLNTEKEKMEIKHKESELLTTIYLSLKKEEMNLES